MLLKYISLYSGNFPILSNSNFFGDKGKNNILNDYGVQHQRSLVHFYFFFFLSRFTTATDV